MRRSTRMMMTRGDRGANMRSRDSRGRYAPSNRGGRGPSNRGGEGPDNYYPEYRYPENRGRAYGRMNRIGYELDEGDNEPIEFPGEYYYSDDEQVLTKEDAMEWVKSMENEDGTTGPHWTLEQTKKMLEQKGIDEDPIDFYVTLNMMYSDYSNVARELNINSTDFYIKLAKAFLDDKDAGTDDKLSAYYFAVVCGE